jgi:hypothetical protein
MPHIILFPPVAPENFPEKYCAVYKPLCPACCQTALPAFDDHSHAEMHPPIASINIFLVLLFYLRAGALILKKFFNCFFLNFFLL